MTKTYSDFIKTGQIGQLDAIKHQSVREGSKISMATTLVNVAAQGLPADAAAFGALDTIAVQFVKWYGPADAAKVFNHYAEVCGRQYDRDADPATEGGDA